ncbi:MAG: hypothetical protein IPM33_02970 [Phycisphaerales bacterium]|nr:hypothetical protein [Phycisphaerales bacterium]
MNARICSMSAAWLVTVCGLATAQDRLPDPPMPPAASSLPTPQVQGIEAFKAAYARSGRPRLLFYADVVGIDQSAGRALRDGGMITALGARLEDLFRDPEVQIVNAGALGVLTEQQVASLRRNDEYAAARMLGDSVGADAVVLVRLLEQRGRRDGASYAASYVIADLRRGTTLGRHAWEMYPDDLTGEFDARRLGEYSGAIAQRVARQYGEAFPESGGVGAMRRFTLRVVGDYEDADLTGLRDGIIMVSGVGAGSVMLRAEDKSAAQSMATLELMYAGDLLDLRAAVREAAVDRLAMEAKVLDAREGTISLRLAPLDLTARQRMLTGGPTTPRNRDERERLAQAYAKAGAPTIAVVINRATVEVEAPLETSAQGGSTMQTGDGVNIIVGERVGFGQGMLASPFLERVIDRELRDARAERREQASLDLRMFEDRLVGRLVDLGLRPKDVSGAQAALSQEAGFKDRAWTDRELGHTLAAAAGADVVITGVGRLVRAKAGEQPLRVEIALRAYRVSDGVIVGATTVQRPLAGTGETPTQALDELAAEATGRLVMQFADTWAK